MRVSDLKEDGLYINIVAVAILKFIAKESETRCKFLVVDSGDPYEISLLDIEVESDLLEYPEENLKNLLLNMKKESEKCSTN